jgi:hypothetical protein
LLLTGNGRNFYNIQHTRIVTITILMAMFRTIVVEVKGKIMISALVGGWGTKL